MLVLLFSWFKGEPTNTRSPNAEYSSSFLSKRWASAARASVHSYMFGIVNVGIGSKVRFQMCLDINMPLKVSEALLHVLSSDNSHACASFFADRFFGAASRCRFLTDAA